MKKQSKMHLLLKFWKPLVAVLLIISVYAWKVLKTKPINISQAAKNASGGDNQIETIARDLAHHLGYMYPVYDPRRWSENDSEIYGLLRYLSRDQVNKVSQVYFKAYAKGRDLKSDLARALDSKYYEALNNL